MNVSSQQLSAKIHTVVEPWGLHPPGGKALSKDCGCASVDAWMFYSTYFRQGTFGFCSSHCYRKVEIFICLYTHLSQGLGHNECSIKICWMNVWLFSNRSVMSPGLSKNFWPISVFWPFWPLQCTLLRIYPSHNRDNFNLSLNIGDVSVSILISLFIIEIEYTDKSDSWSKTINTP